MADPRRSATELLREFWRSMQANDWEAAASHLAPDCTIDWPCSGERFVGRHDFAAVQAGYPSRGGRWRFDVYRLVSDGTTVVSEVTVTDGEQSARLVAFSEIEDGLITQQVEYWPSPYDPRPGRAELARPIERIP